MTFDFDTDKRLFNSINLNYFINWISQRKIDQQPSPYPPKHLTFVIVAIQFEKVTVIVWLSHYLYWNWCEALLSIGFSSISLRTHARTVNINQKLYCNFGASQTHTHIIVSFIRSYPNNMLYINIKPNFWVIILYNYYQYYLYDCWKCNKC